jgi:hypothetical protein
VDGGGFSEVGGTFMPFLGFLSLHSEGRCCVYLICIITMSKIEAASGFLEVAEDWICVVQP